MSERNTKLRPLTISLTPRALKKFLESSALGYFSFSYSGFQESKTTPPYTSVAAYQSSYVKIRVVVRSRAAGREPTALVGQA